MKTLNAQNLTKRYGAKEVLKGINLELQPNKIYGLLGRNGAGKTTLLSILTAQNTHDSGTVTFDGRPVWENREVLNHLCFSRELSQTLPMGQNWLKIQHYLDSAKGYMPGWDEEYAQRLLKHYDLNPKTKIAKLSKGMMSMVTIIIALASKAEFTILDEPVAGLDIVAREEFYKLLLDEYTKTGRTFVISTHIIEEAEGVFEDIIMIDDGKIIEQGNNEELISQFCTVSGHVDEVEQAIAGMKVVQKSTMGRMTTATVRGSQATLQQLQGRELTVSPLSLSKVFVALTSKEV